MPVARENSVGSYRDHSQRPQERLIPPISLPGGCPSALRCDHVTTRCLDKRPSLVEIEPGHEVACWVSVSLSRETAHG
jgi:ABC-type dipeptide/oligopeptide/nickel transport system ATPase component